MPAVAVASHRRAHERLTDAGHMLDDETYFGLREYEETKAALETAEPRARSAHFEMARRYRELADAIAEHRERVGLRP